MFASNRRLVASANRADFREAGHHPGGSWMDSVRQSRHGDDGSGAAELPSPEPRALTAPAPASVTDSPQAAYRLEAALLEAVSREEEHRAAIEWLQAVVRGGEEALAAERTRATVLDSELRAIHASLGWRGVLALRRVVHGLRHPLDGIAGRLTGRSMAAAPAGVAAPSPPPSPAPLEVGAPVDGLHFISPARPRVSIVIPVHGQLELTLQCLRSLRDHSPEGIFEIIVADDASPDATAAVIGAVGGVRLVSSAVNRGFTENAAAGIAVARGEFVALLNNDTEVRPGWLEALLDAAGSAADVGAVGARLLYPDGRLQEAGGIVWADGSAWNLGHGEPPDHPRHNVRREVDYCSAAALLVRRDVYHAVGGLDPRFKPGYYEDTDLCFAIRAAGYRVLYEPRSVVVHHRGATFGDEDRDPANAGRKAAAMERNRALFAAKWEAELGRHWPNGTAGGLRGGRVNHRLRVLVCDHRVPAPDRDSGGVRMAWIIRLLVEAGCEVTVLPEDLQRTEPYTSDLQRAGVEVIYAPWNAQSILAERSGFYDIVILSRRRVANGLIDAVRRWFPTATVIFDTVDLQHVREQRRLALLAAAGAPDDADLEELLATETALIRRADVVSVVSDDEACIVRDIDASPRVVVLPNVHPVVPGPLPGFQEREDLLFIGGYEHPPNVDGVSWFVADVLPIIQRSIRVRLYCLGSFPTERVLALQGPDVIVTGQVPEVDDWFRWARVFVAPLRYGAGVKGKVGQAMSFGVPIVSTTVGGEGLGIVDGVHALIRDDAQEFAAAVLRIYADEQLWTSLSAAGRELITATASPEAMRGRLDLLLADAQSAVTRAGG